jgi:pyruvate dehydrogenase E2 component (dihydrolipoamide acetyltransferase)
VDEAYEFCGIGAEITANLMEDIFYDLDAPVGRIATPNVPLPFSPALEFPIIPSADKIVAKVREITAQIKPGRLTIAIPSNAAVRATPLARAVAAANGADLSNMGGTGSAGKIVRDDVLASFASNAAMFGVAEMPGSGGADAAERGEEGGFPNRNGDKRIAERAPYAGVRKIIGSRLAESKFTAPHLYFTQKADLSELLPLRARINAAQEKKTSVTDFVARASVLTLRKYPAMNASLVGDMIELYENVNIGLAVASPTGLIVPVVKDAQDLSVVALSKRASVLIGKARDGKLMPDEYSGGTFTISNLGMFGIENFTAIINPPEAGILAVSSTKDEAVVVTGENGEKRIEIRPIMSITLSVDHRLIDGLLAARFVAEIKRLLESPLELLI